MSQPIYLDFNATTPIAPSVLEAMLPYLRTEYGNPSSAHVYGQRAAAAVATARGELARLIGASPDEIVFTSGASEANNLAICGVARAQQDLRRHLVTTAIEHPAVAQPCRALAEDGWTVTVLRVDGNGTVSVRDVEEALRPDTALVTVMHANNEVGSIQPVAEIAARCRDRGILVHTDAAQSVGKIAVNVRELGVDLLTIAGHKMYAPKGVGALYVRKGTHVAPLMLGAGHEHGMRAGTENVPCVVALGAAAALARTDPPEARLRALATRFLDLLRSGVADIHIHGNPKTGLPNTVNVSVPGLAGRVWLDRAPGIAASVGAACHAGTDTPSSTLLAMGASRDAAVGATRFSVGRMTTEAEVAAAAAELSRAAGRR